MRLLSAVAPLLAVLGGRGANYRDLTDEIETVISDVERIDPGSYSFRYPVDSKGRDAHPGHAVLNVLHFARRVDVVLDLLAEACRVLESDFSETAGVRTAILDLVEPGGGI